MEQIGRMYVQDGYGEDIVVKAATLSARFYYNSNTVKEIAAYLRRVRKAKSLMHNNSGSRFRNFNMVRPKNWDSPKVLIYCYNCYIGIMMTG